ncbi:putative mitochondrial protein [Tanacetum coccineum]
MNEEDEDDEENVENKVGSHIHLDSVEVSLNSLLGFTSPRTMKIRGILGGVVVTVLIDSGATQNFLSKVLVERLGLCVFGNNSVGVMLGNGGFEESVGLCKGVVLSLYGLQIIEDLFPFELGDPSLNRSLVSLKSILRSLKLENNGYLVELKCLGEPQEARLPTNEAINDLLKEFEDIFQLPEGLPLIRAQDHAINLCEGIIQPSVSPFSSPVLLVKKKDGSWRFCVDYRALNKATILDMFLIPVIDELFDELHGARIFTKLDISSNSNEERRLFFDDILVYGNSLKEHREHFSIIFDCLREQKLFCNRKKSSVAQENIKYLGHIFSHEGVAADPSKISAMLNWPIPKSLKELRGFLGLTGYYQKFVIGYGKIARVLTDLIKKDNFLWSNEATQAFKNLQEVMTRIPVLALPDFSQEFVVETDASGYVVGAVLSQKGRPMAYFSKTLGTRARLKSVYERELMASVMAIKKWRPYLIGRHFIVRTDQRSLKCLLKQRVVTEENQHWLYKLSRYDFEIQYQSGKENNIADALSRVTRVEDDRLEAY